MTAILNAWPQITIGAISVVLAAIALNFTIRRHRLDVSRTLNVSDYLEVFLSREKMVTYLLAMYDRVEAGDIIWGQCVSCRNYSTSVRDKVLSAAAKGAKFEIIINSKSADKRKIISIYENLKHSKVIERYDSTISIQGLSNQEVVIAFPSLTGYVAICIKRKEVVDIIRSWFVLRLNNNKI